MTVLFFLNLACKNSFCKVCCDHLQLELTAIAKTDPIGEKLDLHTGDGEDVIKNLVDSDTIDKCKSRCTEVYPLKLPVAKPAPERDGDLGRDFNPAKSCADIKEWGRQGAKSGTYFIKTSKGISEVFCDMEVDGGGWTLMFNYRHLPGMKFNLNGTVIFFLPKKIFFTEIPKKPKRKLTCKPF